MRPLKSYSLTLADVVHELAAASSLTEEQLRSISITGTTHASNSVEPGDLFIAMPGAKVHGARYAADAVAAGAVAVLTDAQGAELTGSIPTIIYSDVRSASGFISALLYKSPMRDLDSIGITGTNGKTTVSTLLYQLLMRAGRESGLIGTVETRIGEERISSTRTTPEATDLQALAATMRERHMRHLVMEVSSHSMSMKRMKGSHFSHVAFTNLTQDHLDFHQSMEEYFKAKASLFTLEYADQAVINIDDPYGAKLRNMTELPVITLSRFDRSAEWHYTSIEQHGKFSSISIRGTGGILIESRTPLIGGFNYDNLLMAVALATSSGVDPIDTATIIPQLTGAPGRLESVNLGQPFRAFVDYAHTPDAVANVLACVQEITEGKVIAVLGCGGDRDSSKRPLMGKALQGGSDIAIYTSDNPRSEHPASILAEMTSHKEVIAPHAVIEDRKGAITHAVSLAGPGDTVLILGKGHEVGQEVHGVVTPFDDRIVLAHAIEAKP